MLAIKDLHAFYGKSHILHGVSMEVKPGEIVSLLGRNGSGRSTTIKTIMGLVDGHGSIEWNQHKLLGEKTYDIARLGLGYVPESRDVFPKLTVEQNLLLGQKPGASKKKGRWSIDPRIVANTGQSRTPQKSFLSNMERLLAPNFAAEC